MYERIDLTEQGYQELSLVVNNTKKVYNQLTVNGVLDTTGLHEYLSELYIFTQEQYFYLVDDSI